MKTELITLKSLNESFDDIIRAGKLLERGELCAIPTETVYGLAANAYLPEAVEKIFVAKGRPQDNPLIVHISEFSDLEKLTLEIPREAELLASRFWPGPLTMIFKKSEKVPDVVTAGLSSVAVRLPSSKYARAIIHAAGVPLAAPSANTSGRPSPTSAFHVLDDLDGRIPMILDGGECEVGLESTVVDLSGEVPTLLRPGGVTLSELARVIPEIRVNPKILAEVEDGEKVASPGMKYRHYAPKAPITIIDGALENAKKFIEGNINERKVAILCFEEEKEEFSSLGAPVISYGRLSEPSELAHGLFAALRRLDEISPDIIYAREPACGDGIELAIVNRLSRAASFSRISV